MECVFLQELKLCVAGSKMQARVFLSSAPKGKARAQPYLGVAVLKRELCICGESGFAKDCSTIEKSSSSELNRGKEIAFSLKHIA